MASRPTAPARSPDSRAAAWSTPTLPVGYTDGEGAGLTGVESRTAIGLRALLGAPLWLGADVASLPP